MFNYKIILKKYLKNLFKKCITNYIINITINSENYLNELKTWI